MSIPVIHVYCILWTDKNIIIISPFGNIFFFLFNQKKDEQQMQLRLSRIRNITKVRSETRCLVSKQEILLAWQNSILKYRTRSDTWTSLKYFYRWHMIFHSNHLRSNRSMMLLYVTYANVKFHSIIKLHNFFYFLFYPGPSWHADHKMKWYHKRIFMSK